MTLIGYDDILDKDYLFVMSDLIKRHPDASLFQTHFRTSIRADTKLENASRWRNYRRPQKQYIIFFATKQI
jgi:hypothetical protein